MKDVACLLVLAALYFVTRWLIAAVTRLGDRQ